MLVSVESAISGAQAPPGEVRPFLAAIARALRETVASFESTVGTITDITVKRQERPDRELLVILQDFDRLQQEFAALSDVIARLSQGAIASHTEAEALAAISLAALKERLVCHLRAVAAGVPDAEAEDVIF